MAPRVQPARRPAAAPPRPRRRSQAERRATTRGKLLDATIHCLIEYGYAGTTTTAVCQRAGVSQGALFAHFATKQELVCAAAEHLFAGLIEQYRRAFGAVAADADRASAACRLLWEIMSGPRVAAGFELYVAARTDAVLAERLQPVAARHGENLRREARALFPDESRRVRDFDAFLDVVIDAMQGAALGGPSLFDTARNERRLAFVTRLVRDAFAPGAD